MLGTGTAVGKTVVSVALARALARHNPPRGVVAMKPVETGFDPDDPESDARQLGRVSTCREALPQPHPIHAFPDPISPHLAARRAGIALDVDRLASAISVWSDMASWALVETAGGALSPLAPARTNADLARALEPARLIVVAPDSLGVLHDVRATLLALRAVHREPDHVVLSRARPPDASTGTNAAELAALGIATVCAVVGSDPVSDLEPLVEQLLTRPS